ncbi:MAG: hypothetical protein H8K09_13165 [Nitrospira sp.]|nr:hypothetical protein [Nitrospira sp.]
MGRMFTGQFNGVAVTAQQDLFELVAPATAICVIHAIELEQTTEVGDAQEEGLSILLKSGATTSGSGGSTPSKVAAQVSDAASGATLEANNTTKATAGTIVTHNAWSWNVRMPFNKIFTPEMRPVVAPSRRLTLELGTTPADSITMNGTITWEEIG